MAYLESYRDPQGLLLLKQAGIKVEQLRPVDVSMMFTDRSLPDLEEG